jgi:hypothetical protein
MKKIILSLGLVSSLVFAGNTCSNSDINTISKVINKISDKIADKTVDVFIKLGELGAKTACHTAYQTACNAVSDAETVIVGGVSICGATGVTGVRMACKASVNIVSNIIQYNNQKNINKAKKEVSNYFSTHAKEIAKNICDRLNNTRKLTVINKTSHGVWFSVDVTHDIDSQGLEKAHHRGVIGNLPSAKNQKTFTVKAKIIKAPFPVWVHVDRVNPDKHKVKVYKGNDGKYHIKKINK